MSRPMYYAFWNREPWASRLPQALKLFQIPDEDWFYCNVPHNLGDPIPSGCQCKFHVAPRKKWRQFDAFMRDGYYHIGKVEAMTRKLQAMPHE